MSGEESSAKAETELTKLTKLLFLWLVVDLAISAHDAARSLAAAKGGATTLTPFSKRPTIFELCSLTFDLNSSHVFQQPIDVSIQLHNSTSTLP